jgi:hypothetical protein
MDIEFLTQPTARLGDLIEDEVKTLGPPQEFVFVSAFTSLTTVLRLKPLMAEIKAAAGIMRLVLGVDLHGTSKEVLQEVASWDISVIVVKNRMIGVTFHPKVCLMRWHDTAEIIVGSNNLTEGGFYRNYEAFSRTQYLLPPDQAALEKAQFELKRFLEPSGPVASLLTPEYLASLLALPEIPSEETSRRAKTERLLKHPPSAVFGFEPIPQAPKAPKGATVFVQTTPAPVTVEPVPPKSKSKKSVPAKTDTFAIQVKVQPNGEIYLSVIAAKQNPEFFNWPFNGHTTPKKAGNPPYPQLVPDPVVDIVVFGVAEVPVLTLSGYALNTIYYERNHEIRITASPLIGVTTVNSIMVMRRAEAPDRDYEIIIHRPDSPDYPHWLDACDQTMPGGARRFGWL